MTADRYTKIVLTLIAALLTIIASELATPRAGAQRGDCGAENNPCFITNTSSDALWVRSVDR